MQKSPEGGLSHVRGSRLLIVATLRTKRPLFEKKRFLAREGAYISLSPYTRRGLIAQIALSQCEGVYSTHRCHPIQKEVSLTKEPPSCDGIYALLAPYIRRGFLHVKWSILFEGGNDACIGWQRCHPGLSHMRKVHSFIAIYTRSVSFPKDPSCM